jgi:hypothetical protein
MTIRCTFIFRIFTVKHFFPCFHWCLAGLLTSNVANTQTLKGILSNFNVKKERGKMYIMNIKYTFFPKNTGFIFILWYENYLILLVATATYENNYVHTTE